MKGRRHTTDELRDLVKSVRGGEFEYDERPRKSLDWSSYDEAQAYELADMLYLIRKLVDEAANRLPEQEGRRGRGRPPVYSPADVAKASEYARLFEIGVSNIDLKEKARDISIECSGPRGTVDTASLSGGEKVAIALALRFGTAYVMGGYKLDFVVLDEPTIHLDEERKASMVDIISRLGTEDSPLKQVIIITHDAEIFENAEVDSVYRFESTPEGTKVKVEA